MSAMHSSIQPLLCMSNVGKNFPGVRALDGVTLDLQRGEIHAIVGENGAGKSTLMKILSGVYPYPEYEGEIRIEGAPKQFKNVRDSENAGVAIVFQELSLVPELTVGENIFLAREPGHFGFVDWDRLYSQAAALLRELRVDIHTRASVSGLGTGQQQLIEIAKALSKEARILILDEPTAALTDAESDALFRVLRRLREKGIGIVYISHRLEEVFELSDRITVLRDGRTVGTTDKTAVDQRDIISRMVGREISQIFPPLRRTPGAVILEVRHLSAANEAIAGSPGVIDASFAVRRGEVLGIAGLMGAGRTELLMSLFGGFRGRVTGEIFINGQRVKISQPADAIAHGIALVTEDRKHSGLVLNQTILFNMTLAALPRVSGSFATDELREIVAGRPLFDSLQVKAGSLFDSANNLSGGTQQKIVLAKWLLTSPRVLFLDEPTRGVDIGAKQEIYSIIDKLAKSGIAIVMVSSELPEVLGLCDRILVMHEGRISGEFTANQASPEAIMACATGTAHHA
jgi:D-xylose transport system ATP-binding protein